MSEADGRKVIVVGAGLGGALMATYLGRAGFAVEVYEHRGDPRGREPARGRSINLAISTRGLYALEQVGLDGDVLRAATPMRGRMIHAPDGTLTFQPYGAGRDDVIHSVSRAHLNLVLIEGAGRLANVRFTFEHRCTSVDIQTATVVVKDEATKQVHRVAGDFVVGADGAFSVVRRSMQRMDRFDFSQEYLRHGYKELSIPPAADGRHAMEPNALHIWPRHSFMMIALPNLDGSFTCTLFLWFEGPRSFAGLRNDHEILRFFRSEFPDAVPLMPTLVEDFHRNPTGSLVTVRCGPWHWSDKVVLLGDAGHAVVPFYGQGANAAFEDCAHLGALLGAGCGSLAQVFQSYYDGRKRHVDTLADLALHNFIEMRDHTGSRWFLMKKRCERLLHRLFPAWFLPLYSMVTFSRIPYLDAAQRAARQWLVVSLAASGSFLLVLAALVALILSMD